MVEIARGDIVLCDLNPVVGTLHPLMGQGLLVFVRYFTRGIVGDQTDLISRIETMAI